MTTWIRFQLTCASALLTWLIRKLSEESENSWMSSDRRSMPSWLSRRDRMKSTLLTTPSRNLDQFHKANSSFQRRRSRRDQAWKLRHLALSQWPSLWRLPLTASHQWEYQQANLNIKRSTHNTSHQPMLSHSQLMHQCSSRHSTQLQVTVPLNSNFHSERPLTFHPLPRALDSHQWALVRPEVAATCQIPECPAPSISKPSEIRYNKRLKSYQHNQ